MFRIEDIYQALLFNLSKIFTKPTKYTSWDTRWQTLIAEMWWWKLLTKIKIQQLHSYHPLLNIHFWFAKIAWFSEIHRSMFCPRYKEVVLVPPCKKLSTSNKLSNWKFHKVCTKPWLTLSWSSIKIYHKTKIRFRHFVKTYKAQE